MNVFLRLGWVRRRGKGGGRNFLINCEDIKESSETMTLVLNWTAELKK